jgi:hypothetical protein
MSKDLDNRYFIILNKDKIIFNCLNNQNKISFIKKYNFMNHDPNELFKELENFFNDNLIKIEKQLNDFIRKIYIIADVDNALSTSLSIKYHLETEKINYQKVNDLLNILKYQFTKYNNDEKIIHIRINKLLIDGMEKDLSFINKNFHNLILEVKFESLREQFVHTIKKSLSKYQILVEKILLASHIRETAQSQSSNIIIIADKIISGEDRNEVIWVKKKPIKYSFFEKFFNFFN